MPPPRLLARARQQKLLANPNSDGGAPLPEATACLDALDSSEPDEVFDALRTELSEEEILELTYIVCTYDMHATMSKALRLEFDDVDDPIVEVPGPEGVGPSTMDAMRVVEDLD